MICREQVARSENRSEVLKISVLTPKFGIREHKKWSKGAQHNISGHHLLFCSLRQRALGDCSHQAQSHSKPLIACLSPRGTDRSLPAGVSQHYTSLEPLHLPSAPNPSISCMWMLQIKLLAKIRGLATQGSNAHSMCQVSAWFHPKNIPPCALFSKLIIPMM